MHAYSRARPIRIAFLIELDDRAHEILDAVFDYCFSLWGGRFNLIVPCVNGAPLTGYSDWLKVFDADVIYAYGSAIPEDREFALHETFYPSAFHLHSTANDGADLRPHIKLDPLSVASVLPSAAMHGSFDRGAELQPVGALGSLAHDPFFRNSFGALAPGLVNTARTHLAHQVRPMWALRAHEAERSKPFIRTGEATKSGLSEVLRSMAMDARITTAARLSAMATRRMSLDGTRWTESLNLVVGDSVADRVAYWNIRHHMPSYRDGEVVDLWASPSDFEDPTFVDALRDYLRRQNRVSPSHGGSEPRVTLRSLSLDEATLARLSDEMGATGCWCLYSHQHLSSLSDVVPTPDVLKRSYTVDSGSSMQLRGSWVEALVSGVRFDVPRVEPAHLRHVPSVMRSPATGAWALEIDIERGVNHSPYSNIHHRWRLPRRLRVTRSFIDWYQISEPFGAIVAPRVSAGGLLTLYTVIDGSLLKVRLPEDHDAICTGLQKGRDWLPVSKRVDEELPQACHAARRSPAGRYFWGVYQLFGGINRARSFLLHAFWRKQLGAFGALEQRTEGRRDIIETTLRNRLGGRVLDPANDDHLHRLADVVLQEAAALRSSTPTLSWSVFERDFKTTIDDYFRRHPESGHRNLEEEVEHYWAELRSNVQWLCQRGVLHQGVEHCCRQCLHRSWISIEALGRQVRCEVCSAHEGAPVHAPWQFRLNGFLHEAIQKHGIGPLFWALDRMQEHNAHSFWFDGPLDIFEDQSALEQRQASTDIDLTVVSNGTAIMCEVKQSARVFRTPERLAEGFLKLRPDVAMIAVMQADEKSIRDKFARFAARLEGSGVAPRLITLNDGDIRDEPHF